MKKRDDLLFDTDKYLIEMLKIGDNRAFAALYQKYWYSLYAMALRKTQCKETAEELTQEIFLSLWAKKHSLRLEKSFQVYIYSSLKYRIINHVKSQILQRKYREKAPVSHATSAVDEELSYKELHRAFEREFEKLPEKYRTVYLMRKKDGLSFKEISSKLEIPLSTVEKHMGNAMRMLRSNLRDFTLPVALIICMV